MKELDPSPVARTKPQKIATDQAAEAEIRAVVPNRETKKTDGTETRVGIAAEAETDGVIVKGKLRRESHPEAEPIEKEAQIEARREMLTEAGALEAGVIKKKPVKTALLTGRIKNLETTKDDIAAAAAVLTATERKERAIRALIASPKANGAQKSKSQTVLEGEIIIKDLVLLVPVQTVTDMIHPAKIVFIPFCSNSFQFNLLHFTLKYSPKQILHI